MPTHCFLFCRQLAKIGKIGYGRGTNADVQHLGGRRSLAATVQHFIENYGLALQKGFDGAVAAITHPAPKAKGCGLLAHPAPKPDSLNAAMDHHVPRSLCHGYSNSMMTWSTASESPALA